MSISKVQQISYKGRPFLVPRDVYLANNRVIKMRSVDRYLRQACRKTFGERVEDMINFIKQTFVKKRSK